MKLSNAKFNSLSQIQELSKIEQKMILGGYYEELDPACCIYQDINGGPIYCTDSVSKAYSLAADGGGVWSCDTEKAQVNCIGIIGEICN